MKFEEMGLSKPLMDSLAAMGFTIPTPIQEEAIPLLLKGEDLIGQAQTGTGKTAAFGLPILEAWLKINQAAGRHAKMQPHQYEKFNSHNLGNAPARGREHPGQSVAAPTAVILVPTRELAVQVHATLQKMAGHTGANVVPIYGGVEMRKQLRLFRTPVDIVVGTPGRTLDHLRQRSLRIDAVKTVVLDEADRMLDMGFIRDVVKILDGMPRHRQTLLFSATMPQEVAQIAHKYMKNPQTIKVSEDKLTVEGIKQYYISCTPKQRLGMLLAAIRTQKPFLALVFCRMKHEAKKLARVLKLNGIKADALHGNLNQNARERAMERFRTGQIDVMVATDLASRGIDVPGITHVFNYELPDDPMTYVHRIGRTGRAGKEGVAISLINGNSPRAISIIERATGAKLSELTLKPEQPILPEREEDERHREVAQHGGGPREYGEGDNRHAGYGRRRESRSKYGGNRHPRGYVDENRRQDGRRVRSHTARSMEHEGDYAPSRVAHEGSEARGRAHEGSHAQEARHEQRGGREAHGRRDAPAAPSRSTGESHTTGHVAPTGESHARAHVVIPTGGTPKSYGRGEYSADARRAREGARGHVPTAGHDNRREHGSTGGQREYGRQGSHAGGRYGNQGGSEHGRQVGIGNRERSGGDDSRSRHGNQGGSEHGRQGGYGNAGNRSEGAGKSGDGNRDRRGGQGSHDSREQRRSGGWERDNSGRHQPAKFRAKGNSSYKRR